MIKTYRWSRGEEYMLCFGETHANQIIVIQPLFEEANRTRHMLVNVMRELSANGIGAVLPDLPGMGESMTPLVDVELQDWREALEACTKSLRQSHERIGTLSLRGGTLLDDAADADFHWRCAPETGQRLVRDLMRTRLASGTDIESGETLALAGNKVRKSLIDALGAASPAALSVLRTVRLETDQAPSDARIAAGPLWRRSEPGDDPVLQSEIVNDFRKWVSECATS